MLLSYAQVRSFRNEVYELEGQKNKLESRKKELESQVADLEGQQKGFTKEVYGNAGTPSIVKEFDKRKILDPMPEGKRKDALKLAFELYEKNPPIPFKWGGKSLDDGGFDTSGYVAYVLSNVGVLSAPEKYYSGLLLKTFGTKDDTNLQPGDLIFMEPSQVALYLDERHCIGIIPGGNGITESGGIFISDNEFGLKRTGYGKVNYEKSNQ
jgi:cell wall-associated NlpC family hydrolase